jgi:hypothetical protein
MLQSLLSGAPSADVVWFYRVALIVRWAYDYLGNMVSSIDNYISKSPDVFLAGQDPATGVRCLDMALAMAHKVRTALLLSMIDRCRPLPSAWD